MINAPEIEAPLVLSGTFNSAVLSEPLRAVERDNKTIAVLEKKETGKEATNCRMRAEEQEYRRKEG